MYNHAVGRYQIYKYVLAVWTKFRFRAVLYVGPRGKFSAHNAAASFEWWVSKSVAIVRAAFLGQEARGNGSRRFAAEKEHNHAALLFSDDCLCGYLAKVGWYIVLVVLKHEINTR